MKTPPPVAVLPPLTRLSAPSFEPEAAEVYQLAMRVLDDAGIPYMLGGALACNAYTGIWRDTKDLDVFCRSRDWRLALETLAKEGFEPEVTYETWLAKAWRGDYFVDIIWRNANGLFPVKDSWLEHAPTRHVLEREVKVLPIEELILSKIMVGSRYRFDGGDILHLLYAAGDRVDWDRLAEGAGEHIGLVLAYLHMYRWGYPGHADRVPLHVLDEYAKLARDPPSRYGPMRALLMDIPSFQVDVQDWGFPDPHKRVLAEIFDEEAGRA